jgi:hypothetical protein
MTRVLAAVAVAGCSLLTSACGDSSASRRAPASGVWLGPAAPLPAAEAAALEGLGVKELFVESARVVFTGGQPVVEAVAVGDFPRRSLLTLVVVGELPFGFDPAATATALADPLRRHRLDREGNGWLPKGLHFDFAVRRAELEAYAKLVDRLREAVGEGLYVSVTVPRDWVDAPGLSALADAADGLLVMAYGQRPHELDEPAAWDLTEVRRLLRKVDELGRPYLVGVATLGRVARTDRRGGPLGSTAAVSSLREVLSHPRLSLGRGFSLQGVDRQLYELSALAPARVGPWQLERDDRVVLARLASAHLGRYRAELGRLELKHRLGDLFVKLPGPGEGVGLSAANVVAGLTSEHPAPDLLPSLEVVSRRGKTLRLRLTLGNRNQEPSDLSPLDHNWIDLELSRGQWTDADRGDFARAWLVRRTAGGGVEAAYRQPRIVRLQQPLLLGGDSLRTGELELTADGAVEVTVTGRFVLPDGELLALPPVVWTPETAAPGGRSADGGR